MPTTDYEQLAAELIRAWRGPRSLAAFSRRLGSKSNMVHNWEAQRRFPTAAKALWVAERSGVDVVAALEQFYGTTPRWLRRAVPTSPDGVVELLQDWVGQTTINEIAARSGRSRFAVRRWLSGEAQPRLPDFLRLLDAASLRLTEFVAAFAPVAQVPSMHARWQKLQTAQRLAYEAPWSHAVLRALELERYTHLPSHSDSVLAHALGIEPKLVRECLQLLADAGQIKRGETHYTITAEANVDTRPDRAANLRLKEWWSEVGLSRLSQGANGQFSYNLFSVSVADLERIRELHLRYFRELRGIVAQSAPSERVAVVNVQLFDLMATTDAAKNSVESQSQREQA